LLPVIGRLTQPLGSSPIVKAGCVTGGGTGGLTSNQPLSGTLTARKYEKPRTWALARLPCTVTASISCQGRPGVTFSRAGLRPAPSAAGSKGTLTVTGSARRAPCGVTAKMSDSGVKPRGTGGAPLASFAMVTDTSAGSAPAGTSTRAPSWPSTVPPAGPSNAVPAGRAACGGSAGPAASPPPPPQAATRQAVARTPKKVPNRRMLRSRGPTGGLRTRP
jgi:hypothetical protein